MKLTTLCDVDQKHHREPTCTYADSPTPSSPSKELRALSPATEHPAEDSGVSVSGGLGGLATPSSSHAASYSVPSPEPSDLKLTKSGTGFKDSTHWTSVLSGVTEAKARDDSAGAIQPETTFDDGLPSLEQNVLLFEGCKHPTDQELFASMPPRREADGLVAFYFRAQEYRSVIHPTEFLKRYNAFWENPSATSVTWLGLLYSIFCLTSQVQCQESLRSRAQSNSSSAWSPPATYQILDYREKVVQCLVRGQFAKGGHDIMETLVHYCLIENYLNRDSNIGVWLLMGNIVQIAIRMGYHRDPQHFKSLSPYQGEMRRRMWAMIYSLDIGFSTQMGLPGNIKHSLSDTMPPRNLQDRDFDASSTELPPARPIDELTSSTVILAKLHLASNMGVVSDMVCNPLPLSYEDLVAANTRLDVMQATMPDPCKFRPLSESLLDPPPVVFQRINFYMHYQRARILINWKFLGTAKDTAQSTHCWSIVMEATLEIMRLQHLMAEESNVLEALRPTGMVDSCFMNNGYFLAASIACFLLQHRKERLSAQDLWEVRGLLEKSLAIWSRTNDLSREASRVVTALRVVLEKPEEPGARMDTRTEPRGGGDSFGRSQVSASSFASFFEDLPLMMTDVDTASFPSLPSIPMIDYWPHVDRNS
ncbi:fungal specific transcription factor domain-containingprotein [Purpureocillium lilacinum]|uniref:Fungal specific transcription factor domain-containingprotein n=1 Tax=Purpureocillium lilacinum TaxID=33203 RepID=A0A179H8D2_PURLI|nr:fungal specific transcription factor domain-containingprotein [Purpureocillium lilacinum]OAQ85890.1 fungal specific transcription factor domain-containingprotein [Purpureocillium lilacinum]